MGLTKLTELSKLASAYYYLIPEASNETLVLISDKFGYVRRSLSIEDLEPQPACTEGLNGKGPTHF